MHGDAALSEEIRLRLFPNSRLKGEANLLIMPTLDAANISFNLLKVIAGEGITIGPILLGAAKTVPYPDADGDGAAAGEYDGAVGGGCGAAAVTNPDDRSVATFSAGDRAADGAAQIISRCVLSRFCGPGSRQGGAGR